MKIKTTLVVLFCLTLISSALFGQSRETRKVSGFSTIDFRIPGKLYLRQEGSEKVEIEASKDLLSRIETKVEGSKLIISTPGKFTWRSGDDNIKVYVSIRTLEGLSVSGSGDILGEGKFSAQDVELRVSGSGSLKLALEATGEVDANVSGSGQLMIEGRSAGFESHVSGSGRVGLNMTVAGKADFDISGSGQIDAGGRSDSAEIDISGSGKVLAADMQTKRCDVKITGSGDVEIHVLEELDSRISGSGSVSYKGNPSKVNNNASGSGTVRKM